jgi:uncharacterized protein DUF4013
MTGSIGGGSVTAINDAGEAFAWPFHGPDWFARMILQGLINVIPIIGWISLGGWMMRTIDNFRAGRRELAPAGFHLARGVPVSFAFLIYGILLSIPGDILDSLAAAFNNGVLSALGGLAYLLTFLFLAFLSPVLILFVYRGGFAGGFDFANIWRTATGANTANTFVAAAVMFAAGLIGGLGWILCIVGLLFTQPYQQAITAGVVTWYERVVTGGPAPAPQVTATG